MTGGIGSPGGDGVIHSPTSVVTSATIPSNGALSTAFSRFARATARAATCRRFGRSRGRRACRSRPTKSSLPARTARVGVRVTALSSALGGGSLPGETIPSFGLVVEGRPPDPLLDRLRTGDPPVVAHVQGDAVLLDLRTVDPADDSRLSQAIRAATAAIG